MKHTYDSAEELHFSWFLDELQQSGFIKRWVYQPKPFPLTPQVDYEFIKHLKTKDKTIRKLFLRSHNYQADFLIVWDKCSKGIFFDTKDDSDVMTFPFIIDKKKYRSIIDVKGGFNRNNTWRIFSIEQKWVWQKFQVYVQKIIPKELFKKTFTPQRYLFTDKNGQRRKFNYTPISIYQFIEPYVTAELKQRLSIYPPFEHFLNQKR